MMTATMAATKDTNQLELTNANANNNKNSNNITHNNTTSITPTGSNDYPLRGQPFYQYPTTTKSKLIMPTTITPTTMGRTINIGFTRHTHTYKQNQRTNESGEINERVQRNEMTGRREDDSVVGVVVVDVDKENDDDEGNVDGNGYLYRDSIPTMTPAAPTAGGGGGGVVLVGDVNFSVDSRHIRPGMPMANIALNIDNEYEVEDIDVDDVSDSSGSMETLSDNVAVWVDGEKHWVAGVDANTTCSDLIGALLNYQNAQLMQQKQYQQQQQQQQQQQYRHHHQNQTNHQQQQHHQHMFNVRNTGKNNENNNNTITNSNITTNTSINQSTLIKTSTNTNTYTKENCGSGSSFRHSNVELTVGGCCPKSTTTTISPVMALTVPACSNEYVIVKQHHHYEEYLDGNAKVFDILPSVTDGPSRKECELLLRRLSAASNITSNTSSTNNSNQNSTAFAAFTRPSSPSFNLNTQVSSLLSTDKDSGMGSPVGSSRSARLRRRKYKSAATVSWLAQANTLHPRVSQRAVAAFSGLSNKQNNAAHSVNNNSSGKHIPSLIGHVWREDGLEGVDALAVLEGEGGGGGGGSANERLLKIILAQDETIHRQLVLLREKERQISKIEEEKHRVRERELGKNYLLETYLNGLDEAAVEPNNSEACTDIVLADSPFNEFNDVRAADTAFVGHVDYGDVDDGNDDVEVYIDEPYQRTARTVDAHTTAVITTTTTKKDIAATKTTKGISIDARHSKKMKGDFTGGVGESGMLIRGENIDANEPTNVKRQQGNEKEIEGQLFWLEKIYALNKQLQREEETLLKLHAKIRKHQVKRAYQTKREVLQQIEKMDAELTLQCCDIRAVESKLHASNEQLKQKLSILERLSQEFIERMNNGAAEESVERDAVDELAIGANGQRTVNRMPGIIDNDKHILATQLRAAELMVRRQQNELQVADADELHTKQLSDVLCLATIQQSCQLQICCDGGGVGVADDVAWQHAHDAHNKHLPHATQSGGGEEDLHANLNEISEQTNVVMKRNTRKVITNIAEAESEAEVATITTTTATMGDAIKANCATTVLNTATACDASMLVSATSCSASSSKKQTTVTTTTTTTTTPGVTTTTTNITTSTFGYNNIPIEGKQTNSLYLPQTQQQQQQQQQYEQQQKQFLLPTADYDNNAHQCVVANDVLVDDAALVTVGGGTQSNYPISCINHAAVHATSQHSTRQIVVTVADGATIKLAMSEQTLPPAGATLSVGYLTSSAANMPLTNQQQLQQQLQVQQQNWQHINMNSNCISNTNTNNNNNNYNDKNLLPPLHAGHTTKTLEKQMFGPKSLNQMLPSMPPPNIILKSASAVTAKTTHTASASDSSSTAMLSPKCAQSADAGYCSAALLPTSTPNPTALLASPANPVLLDVTTTQRSNGVDITQLGTLV